MVLGPMTQDTNNLKYPPKGGGSNNSPLHRRDSAWRKKMNMRNSHVHQPTGTASIKLYKGTEKEVKQRKHEEFKLARNKQVPTLYL